MKKNYFLILLSANIPTEASEKKQLSPTDENSKSIQSLTPNSPNYPIYKKTDPFLPLINSNDSNDEISIIKSESKEKLQVAKGQHQKRFDRLKKDKERFFADQERERENTTFSRWEKFNKKPEKFKKKQQDAAKEFLTRIQEQLLESQAYELKCLNDFLRKNDSMISKKSPKKLQSEHEKNQLDLEKMKERHSNEERNLLETPDLSSREKLLKFWKQ